MTIGQQQTSDRWHTFHFLSDGSSCVDSADERRFGRKGTQIGGNSNEIFVGKKMEPHNSSSSSSSNGGVDYVIFYFLLFRSILFCFPIGYFRDERVVVFIDGFKTVCYLFPLEYWIISHLLLRLVSGNLYTKPGAQISRPHANMISREWSNTIPSFVHFSGCFLIDTANNQNITVVVFIMCWHVWVKGKCHEWSHFYNAMLEMTTRQEMCKNVVQLCESRQHIL